jgi:uncharacterized protein DUF4440
MSQVAEVRAIRLLEAISDAFRTKDWRRLRSLYHDQARIVSVAAGERVLSADELIEVLSEMKDASASYSTDEAKTRAFDDNAVVVSGVLRQRDEVETLFIHTAWLLTFDDGLVWRSMAFRSIDDARAAYDELGLDLGLS